MALRDEQTLELQFVPKTQVFGPPVSSTSFISWPGVPTLKVEK